MPLQGSDIIHQSEMVDNSAGHSWWLIRCILMHTRRVSISSSNLAIFSVSTSLFCSHNMPPVVVLITSLIEKIICVSISFDMNKETINIMQVNKMGEVYKGLSIF